VANCINCANYVYFLALERCRLLGSEDALKVGLCHCVCLWILPLYLHVVIVAALNISNWQLSSQHIWNLSGVCTRNAQPPQRPRSRHSHPRLGHSPHRISIHLHGNR
jgi:hypothetical protein